MRHTPGAATERFDASSIRGQTGSRGESGPHVITSPPRVRASLDPSFRVKDGKEFLWQEQGLVQAQLPPEPGYGRGLHVGTGQLLISTEDRPRDIV